MKYILLIGAALLVGALAVVGEGITYNYDSAGRLTGVNYGGGRATTFHYDATGNLLRQADSVFTDTDNDGMPDAWELSFFGTLSRDGRGDFDGDGMSDVAEFLAGTLPNNPGSLLRLDTFLTEVLAGTEVSWDSVGGVTYRVQFQNSLGDPGWNDLPGDVTAVGTTTTKTDTTTSGESERFYRVQVVP